MSVRKAFIANKTMEVISEDEYIRRSKFADPMFEDTCVEKNGTLYPIQKRYNEGAPGVYDAGPCFKYTNPTNKEDYSANKIIDFDNAIGLDQSVLGEEIHPKVFGAIKRIKDKDESILGELENDIFVGGEK